MNKIIDKIYIGCWEAAANLNKYNPHRITHVLNCTKDKHTFINDPPFTIRQIDMDDGYPISKSWMWIGITAIKEAIYSDNKILVHCHAGISRSPSIVAAYLITCGFSWDEALNLISRSRDVMPHPAIKRSILRHLDQAITKDNTTLGE